MTSEDIDQTAHMRSLIFLFTCPGLNVYFCIVPGPNILLGLFESYQLTCFLFIRLMQKFVRVVT